MLAIRLMILSAKTDNFLTVLQTLESGIDGRGRLLTFETIKLGLLTSNLLQTHYIKLLIAVAVVIALPCIVGVEKEDIRAAAFDRESMSRIMSMSESNKRGGSWVDFFSKINYTNGSSANRSSESIWTCFLDIRKKY